MDDVIISSPSFTHHVEHLREVFRLLQEAGLTFDKVKCKFGCDKLKYLGFIISKDGITPDETEVRAIVEIKPPRILKRYPNSQAQRAFDAVEMAITDAPVLKFPDFEKPSELFTDASSIGLDAVLNQEERPVVYASRTLSSAERNYAVTERECLAVVWALNQFRAYLGPLPVKVITDHATLTHLINDKKLSSRMIRWVLKLATFDIEQGHRPGNQNAVADVLSRNPVESTASNRKPLVKSSPGSCTEPDRRANKCKKETSGFKRSWQSGFAGTERKLPAATTCDQEEVQRWSPDQPIRRGHNKEDRFESEEAEINNSTDPVPRSIEGQTAEIPEAEVVNNSIARRGKKKRTATDPFPWRS
ncbi:retrovirus-related Pol polyprotein from transposon 17.6 [Trichonephila clavipes]|nr:retrovirus-related Pol polyprotein from transposon 17.6 [Trichonephila clavipes]